MEEPKKNGAKSELQDAKTGKFIAGNPGGGRPKGSISITNEIKKFLRLHPEKLEELREHYMTDLARRDLLWRMIDGNPKQPLEHSLTDPIVVKQNEDGSTVISTTSESEQDTSEQGEVQGDNMREKVRENDVSDQPLASPSVEDTSGGVLVHSADVPPSEGDSVENVKESVPQAPETVAEKSE